MSSGSEPSSVTSYSRAMRSPPPLAEDVLLVAAVRADVEAHVLDDAEHRHVDLLEHLEPLARVQQRDVLRRGDDHGAGDRHALRQRELDVAGARRHVDDQVIEHRASWCRSAAARAPASPSDRARPSACSSSIRKPIDIACMPCALHRLERLAVLGFGAAGDAEHGRLRRAVDVGVEHADARALGCKRQREVDRGRATCRRRPCPTRRR